MNMPFRRRADAWPSRHERARSLAAERLIAPLAQDEGAWLDRHLAECPSCRQAAQAYVEDRFAIRALRRDPIEPPRDLWARTSAAIERERDRERRPAATPPPRRSRSAGVPLGAVAGVLVVAVVVGASLLAGRPAPTPSNTLPPVALGTTPPPTPAASDPGPTPLTVAADIAWLSQGDDGGVELNQTSVSEVCAQAAADCAPLQAPSPGTIDLPDTPATALLSPDDQQLVLVGGDDGGDGTVLVVPVPTPGASGTPRTTAAPSSPPPASTASPVAPVVSASVPPTTPAVSSQPSGDTSGPSSPSSEPSETAAPTPTATPEPTATPPAGGTQIAEDMVVVGATAAFSPDGQRFAFSGRPTDGSAGPDVYVWTVGDATATRMTDDHRSVFAGWLGDLVLASRTLEPIATGASADPSAPVSGASAPPAVTEYDAETFLIDPETGGESVFAGVGVWRPSVNPTGTRAVYWQGTLRLASNGVDWRPATGRLVVGPWPAPSTTEAGADPGGVSGSPGTDHDRDGPSADVAVLDKTAVREWDARWDQTGDYLAVWIADSDGPSIGRLSLYVVDPRTGELDLTGAPLRKERALPGFAMGEQRLVWATPPGQDAKGSHVKVLAWTDEGIGKVETAPGGSKVVVIR